MQLPVVRKRVYRQRFRGAPDVVEIYVATFHTARDTRDGFHHVAFCPRSHGPYRDGLSVNGTWFEDQHGDDLFAIELWSELTCQVLDEFEADAEVYESVFDPERPDAFQVRL